MVKAVPIPGLFWPFTLDIEASYDSIQTKDGLNSLLWSWFNYVDRINCWFYTVFPWEVGKLMPRLDPEYLDKAAKLQGYKVVTG